MLAYQSNISHLRLVSCLSQLFLIQSQPRRSSQLQRRSLWAWKLNNTLLICSIHVCDSPRREQTCSTAVHNPSFGQALLQLQDHAADFGGFSTRLRHQILCLVALVKDDEAVKGRGAPLTELVNAGGAVVAARDEGRIAQQHDSRSHIQLHTDPPYTHTL